jgi:hypothetical protein
MGSHACPPRVQINIKGGFDIRDDAMVKKAISRSNVVINLIGQRQETMNFGYEDVHHAWPKKLAQFCKEAGHVERFIHFSDIGADEKSSSRRMRTKALGDKAVREIIPSATIFKWVAGLGFGFGWGGWMGAWRSLPGSTQGGSKMELSGESAGLQLEKLRGSPGHPPAIHESHPCPSSSSFCERRPAPIVGIEDYFYNFIIYQVSYSLLAPMVDNGEQRVQPTYVIDVAQAVINALQDKESKGKDYYLGGPEVLT